MRGDPRARLNLDQLIQATAASAPSTDRGQYWAEVLDSMQASGVDISQPLPAAFHLVLPGGVAVRQAGAELLAAGYPGVRATGGGPVSMLDVLMQMVLTVEALREVRGNLDSFAGARGGYVAGDAEGGEQLIGSTPWPGSLRQPISEQEMQAIDQNVVDSRFAWDVDLRSSATVTIGIGFGDESSARRAGAELFVGGWPEIHIVRGESFWVVEVPVVVVPTNDEIRKLREELAPFAAGRGGSLVGLRVESDAPNEVQQES